MLRSIFHFTSGAVIAGSFLASIGLAAPLETPRAKRSSFQTVGKVPAARTKSETPAASLARLREQLAAGQRDEFPVGTVARGGSHFFILPDRLSWPEARQFAELHGAHLAVLATDADREWFRTTFEFKKPVWVGAGKSAHDRWQWLDASPWSPPAKLSKGSKLHRFLAISSKDGLFSANSAQEYGVALQWHRDGSNPATLDAQLHRVTTSAKAKDPSVIAYPFGTQSFGDSHFFYLENAMSWNDARKYADSLGAYLAVPSSAKELSWIVHTFTSGLTSGEAIWLGGFRLKPGDRWQWLSREAWNNTGWKLDDLQETPTLNRLALQKTGARSAHWVATDGSHSAAKGILLEWSPNRTPVPDLVSDWKSWLLEANRTVAADVDAERRAFRKRCLPLLKDYVRAMKRATRNGSDRLVAREIERGLEAAEMEGRILPSLPKDAPDDLVALHESMQAKIAPIQGEFEQNINGHLIFYVDGIRERSKQLAAHGYLEIALKMNALILPIQDNQFVPQLLSGTPPVKLPWGKM